MRKAAPVQAVDVSHVSYKVATGLLARPRWLLRDVSLSVPTGGALALIGANGAGKTTLLKAMLGTLRPHAGVVRLFGRIAADPTARIDMGFMPERPPFPASLRAHEVMYQQAQLAGFTGDAAREEATDRLTQVGLATAQHQATRTFSKGMLQRLSLAQALVGQPRLLLLDEPMSGLDPEGRLLVRDLLLVQRSLGTTLLFSSHAMADVELLADKVVVMDEGRIIQQGSTGEVLEHSVGSIEIIASGDVNTAVLRHRLPACHITPHARHTICEVSSLTDADSAIDTIRQSGGHVLGVARRPPGSRAPEGHNA